MAGPAVTEGAGLENGSAAVDEPAVEEHDVPLGGLHGDLRKAVALEQGIEGVVLIPPLPGPLALVVLSEVPLLHQRASVGADLDVDAAVPRADLFERNPG